MADPSSEGPASSNTVTAMLLQEAHQEISGLRTDLYNTRRAAEERRQAVEALTLGNQQLTRQVAELQASLSVAQAQLSQLSHVQAQCTALQETSSRLAQEVELASRARRILESELQQERQQKQALCDAKAVLESDRARLQKARDESAMQLRVSQQRVREAEAEQLRAEEEAADLKAELRLLQAQAGALTHGGGGGLTSADGGEGGGGVQAARTVAEAVLHEQVEYERQRAASLLSSLHAAKAELIDMQHTVNAGDAHASEELRACMADLAAAHTQISSLEQQLALQQQQLQQYQQQPSASRRQSREVQQQHQQSLHQYPHQEPHHAPSALAHHAYLQPNNHSSSKSQHVNGGGPQARKPGLGSSHGSSSQLQRPPPEAGAGSDAKVEELWDEIEQLNAKVGALKSSRDKLLAQIDKQWEEMERLAAENRALSDEAEKVRVLADSWEAQTQDGLMQIDALKDLLEESANWSLAATPADAIVFAKEDGRPGKDNLTLPVSYNAGPVSNGFPLLSSGLPNGLVAHQKQHQNGGSAEATLAGDAAGSDRQAGSGQKAALPTSLQALQSALLAEKVRSSELDLQLRALAAELLRVQHCSINLGRSFLPLLAGIETRLDSGIQSLPAVSSV